jgi:hypothetical protein
MTEMYEIAGSGAENPQTAPRRPAPDAETRKLWRAEGFSEEAIGRWLFTGTEWVPFLDATKEDLEASAEYELRQAQGYLGEAEAMERLAGALSGGDG